jgi:two-component system NtrC family sensor kinase
MVMEDGVLIDSEDEAEVLSLVAHAIDTGVLLCAGDGRIEWVNREFTRTTGFEAAEVVGRRRTELMHGPFTRTDAFQQLDEDLAAGREVDVEFMSLTKSGRPLWTELRLRRVIDDAGRMRLVGTERDITVRRQAQEKARVTVRKAESLTNALRQEKRLLASVLATIPVSVWWKNTELRFVGCNQAYLYSRGLSTQAEIVGRTEEQIAATTRITAVVGDGVSVLPAHLTPRERLEGLERYVLATGEPTNPVQVNAVMTDGTRQQGTVVLMPHLGPQGELEGVIGVGTDVTHVAELERQLAQANRLEAIGQLAAGIAHEINTPVQYIADNTRFLTDAFADILPVLRDMSSLGAEATFDAVRGLDLEFFAAEVPSALEQSLEGLERVTRIVRAMKDFSHPGEGRGDTDLNRAIESTVQVARNEWKYVAELELDLDEAVGKVPCYEGELKQVVLNIVVNAAHALGEQRDLGERSGPGRIRVGTRRDGERVRIEISDDGPGMAPDVQSRIFDPFFTTKPVGVGTGQGLSLAHSVVVQKHGGTIDVKSEPGEGALFVIEIPAPAPWLRDAEATAGEGAADPEDPEDAQDAEAAVEAAAAEAETAGETP